MKKSEWFAFLAGILGFIADFITLTLFFGQRVTLTASDSVPSLVRLQGFVILTMIYGWFIITWMLVRRHWLKAREKGSKTIKDSSGVLAHNELFRRVGFTVIGIGLFILPFSMMLPINDRIPARDIIHWFIFSLGLNSMALALAGSVLVFAISFLMPIIYDDLSEMLESKV